MAVALAKARRVRQEHPERKLRRLRRRFAQVTRRLERRAVAVAPPLLVVALIALSGFAALVLTSPWSLGVTLRHLAAAPSCSLARAVGLAPASPATGPGTIPTWTGGPARLPAGRTGPRLLGSAMVVNDRRQIPRWRMPGPRFADAVCQVRGDVQA